MPEPYGGPWLFGQTPTVADAMFAPVCSRFVTYAVELDPKLKAYCDHIFAWPLMQEWIARRRSRTGRDSRTRGGVLI